MLLKDKFIKIYLWFPQSTTSLRAVKKPRLVSFWDGFSEAFSAVIHAVIMVFKTEENNLEDVPDGDINDTTLIPISTNLNNKSSLPKLV